MSEPTQDNVFWSEAIYGAITGEPMVKINYSGQSMMMDTDSARRVAKDIIDTAHAADADAFVVSFFRDKLGAPLDQAVGMLREFREWRVERSEDGR